MGETMAVLGILKISTHTLREEGDFNSKSCKRYINRFQPTPSARRVTRLLPGHELVERFQPTPSARRVTMLAAELTGQITISTHTLREEGDTDAAVSPTARWNFNPHPPRGG